MNFRDISARAQQFIVNNSPAILTGIGVAGALTTAYLTGTASFKAAQIIDQVENLRYRDDEGGKLEPKEKLQLVWKLYVPAVGTAAVTVVAIIFANRISDRRTAAITAAYSLSEKAIAEYREKIVEKMGAKKEQAARDELNQERVNKNPIDQNIVIIGKGDVLCYEVWTGRYFMSDMESIRKAVNDLNERVLNDYYASLTDFYDLIGLPSTKISDDIGWNTDHKLEMHYSAVLSEDNRPCIAFEYNIHPIKGYNRLS